MKQHSLQACTVIIFLALSQGLRASEEISTLGSIVDTAVTCAHWIVCPYCLVTPERLLTRFQTALDNNDPKTIAHIIRRRGFGANQLLPSGYLPLTYAAQKAHVESVKQLLSLGSDVNSQLKGNQFEGSPSALIAVCATEKLPPEKVIQVVKMLLDSGADLDRTVVMLTESEKVEFEKLRKELAENPSKERQIAARIPEKWFSPRSALDFAIKNKYADAVSIIRQTMTNPQKKVTKKDEPGDVL
jgi:ankyrin repeat protein